MFHNPVEQRFFKANVGAGLFALDPLVFQNFFALGQKFLVEDRIFQELRTLFGALSFSRIFHKKICGSIFSIRRTSGAFIYQMAGRFGKLSRQLITKAARDFEEFRAHRGVWRLGGDRHSAVAGFARRDVDRDLA